MVAEADECEAALLKDIEALQGTLAGKKEHDIAADAVLESQLTPLDRYWTMSALLGRLRADLTVPSILSVTPVGVSLLPPTASTATDAAALSALLKNPAYTKKHTTTIELLATWKKISTHRSTAVFRRPVKPEEAPGYTDRIVFPMDMSLIRKMIVARKVQSYADLHQYMGLISHNCVKYNGRETDYGHVARDFEATADEVIRQAVHMAPASPTLATPSLNPGSVASAAAPTTAVPES